MSSQIPPLAWAMMRAIQILKSSDHWAERNRLLLLLLDGGLNEETQKLYPGETRIIGWVGAFCSAYTVEELQGRLSSEHGINLDAL